MSHQERLETLCDALASLDRIDETVFERLLFQISQASQPFGFDADGKLRVAFYDAKSYDKDSFQKLRSEKISWQFIPTSLNQDTAGAAANCKVACVFVNDTCDDSVIRSLRSHGVEMIALRCAGYNNVDLSACEEHSISVVRVPAYSPYAIAEHSVALMLMLNRKLHKAYLRNRAGSFVLDGLTGFDMRGKVVGIVGTGAIGASLAEILSGFGCRILAYDKRPDSDLVDRIGVEYVAMDQLLAQSHIVSLHVPLFPETQYLIDDQAIEIMRPGAMLINTSRGGLVDTKALIRGLKTGKVGSAGLDVYEEEAGIFFHDRSGDVLTDDVLARLMSFNNVVITSHQAFLTHEALTGIAETTLQNIQEFIEGRRGHELTNVVLP